jgi:flagellar biosynthesis protein FlhG
MVRRVAKARFPKSIAIVSGKGGSGKTLVAAALAHALAIEDKRVLLVDADLGTGGLTYYLGFSAFDRARAGLTEYLIATRPSSPLNIARARADAIKENPGLSQVALLAVGEHRLIGDSIGVLSPTAITRVISKVRTDFDFVIFDCRGGLDEDSIAVCRAVDEVLMVVETDAAAIQASQYLSNRLYEFDLGHKILGFLLNKVMDDPSSLAKAGISFFRTEYIGAIPFDIETTRGFIKGELPNPRSLFSRHVAGSLLPLFGEIEAARSYRTLKPNEFGYITLRNPDSGYGSLMMGVLLFYGLGIYFFALYVGDVIFSRNEVTGIVLASAIFGIAALSDNIKQAFGKNFREINDIFLRILRTLR